MSASLKAQSGRPMPHDSATRHVSGTARYVDDLSEPEGLLHAALHLSDRVHARIRSIDLSKALALPGVVTAITVADVPGDPDIAPVEIGRASCRERVCQYV